MERPVILTKARQWTLFGAGVVVGGLAVMTLVGLATFIGSGVALAFSPYGGTFLKFVLACGVLYIVVRYWREILG